MRCPFSFWGQAFALLLNIVASHTAAVKSFINFSHFIQFSSNQICCVYCWNQKYHTMKTQNIILSFALLFISFVTNAQTPKQETIKVNGNCGMCKKKIETAAKNAGASYAAWNADSKVLTVKYDAAKTDSKKIQQKVAAAGYDTQDATATKEAYEKLDECCQYDRKVKGN